MTFLDKLDNLMHERGLNKNTLSKACGIPYTTIDGWYKKGYEGLKVSTLKKLTEYFGKPLEYWLDGDEARLLQKMSWESSPTILHIGFPFSALLLLGCRSLLSRTLRDTPIPISMEERSTSLYALREIA